MSKTWSLHFAIAVLFLTLCTATARAGQEKFLQSEETFVAQMGERAVFVAPGVYEVEIASGERIRVGFGEHARRYDRARLQEELQAARSAPDGADQSRKIQVLTRALRGLADEPSGELSKLSGQSAVTGATCNYEFTLDGGYTPWMVGGESWGNASIGKDIDFGPEPPPSAYPRRAAYTYVATTFEIDQTYSTYAEDYDEVTSGLGTASTSAATNCCCGVWSCSSWESFSYVRDYGCFKGYRSIYRFG